METTHYDYIIIGTGAGGATLAMKLAPTGKSILILERGDFIPREKENWDAIEVFTKGRYRTQEKWYDANDQPFEPFTHYCVGGNTKMYGAALLRLREKDFEEVKHAGGTSPAWPIRYSDLEAYYTEAEKIYSVHGLRNSDPTEPHSTEAYPFPPVPAETSMAELFSEIKNLGYRPFPIPIAVRLGDEDGTAKSPVRLSNFDGFPDLTEAKADAHVVALKEAMMYPNVTLRTGAYAEKLITDPSGKKIDKVIVKFAEQSVEFSAETFVVACGAINSAALFLRSANAQHPNGLSNGSGQVGRNYMVHNNGALIAVSEKYNNAQFQKHFGITDFYYGSTDFDFPLGTIQLMGKSDPDTLLDLCKAIYPEKSFEELSSHSVDFWLTTEDLPLSENRVTLREDGSIRISYTPNNRESYERLKQKLKDIFNLLGERNPEWKQTRFVGYDLGVSGVSHQNGTLRFGTDPATSVLDPNCKTHEIDNLYVCDASFFPSCGAVNPSLTIMANALRVGEHLIEKYSQVRKGENQSVKSTQLVSQ